MFLRAWFEFSANAPLLSLSARDFNGRLPHPPFSCFVSMRISKGDNPEVVGSPWRVIEGPGGGPEEVSTSKGAVGGAVKINTFELEISFSLRTETQIDIDVSRCRKIVHK